MAPILYCRCSNCVCKATVLLTDTIKINGTSQEREDVPDVEKVSVMIEEYVEHNESRKENVEMRGGGVELELEGGSGAQPPLESLLSLTRLCKTVDFFLPPGWGPGPVASPLFLPALKETLKLEMLTLLNSFGESVEPSLSSSLLMIPRILFTVSESVQRQIKLKVDSINKTT